MSPSFRVSKTRVQSLFFLFGLALALSLGAAEAYGQPAIIQNFDGLDSSAAGSYPPDPNLAAGPNHVVEMVNEKGRIWDKTGGLVQTFSLAPFFGFSQNTYITDPVVHYDATSGRWFASIGATTSLNLAVSQSDDPTGSWWVYHFYHSDEPDYPRMGINDDKVVISYFPLNGTGLVVYILNKSELITGSAADYVTYIPDSSAGTIQPVVSLTGTTTEYMIDNSFTTSLTLYSITGVPGVGAVNISTTSLPFRPTASPPDAEQPDTSIRIDIFGDILLSAVWRDGSLWTSAIEGCVPSGDTVTRSCLRLIQATTTGTPLPPNSIQFAATGDLNGDGKPDLAVANAGHNAVSILLGDGTGSFGPPADFAAGGGPHSVAIGDVNEDGKPDLAVTTPGTNAVSILLGDGAGSFGPPASFPVGNAPAWMTVGDVNGDGKPDLAVANAGDNTVSVLLGNGDGSFAAAPNVPTGNNTLSVAIGDLNGDGRPDLAAANFNDNTVTVVFGNGDGTFGGARTLSPGSGPETVAIRDLNGDGRPDLAVTNFYDNTVSVFLADGAGWFGPRADFATGSAPTVLVTGDLNGDGHPDLAVTDVYAGSVSILLGDGAGSFGAAANFAAGGGLASLAMGDLNGDGKQDLAVANSGSNTVSLLFGDGAGSFGPPSAVGWDPGPHVVQDMTYGTAGYYYFYPAIVTDAAGNLEVVFGRSSSTEYAGVRITGRLQTDPLNTLQASSLLQPGLTANTSGRWGDYFGAALDPSDSSKVWVVGEYGKISTSGWGTRIAELGVGVWGLDVRKSGTGGGTVGSSPPGIDCGTNCLGTFSPGTVVTLTATPDNGSSFIGWSGDADCSDGTVMMDTNKICTATFNLNSGPDLVMTQVSTTATAVAPGKTFTLSNTVKNQGTVSAGSFVIAFHLSLDANYGGSDDVIMTATRSVGSLGIGVSSTATTTLTVPSTAPLGTYYVCAMADSGNTVAETNETNNARCTSGMIQVTQPDLVMTDVTPGVTTVNAGATLPVTDTVLNQGLIATGNFKVGYNLSPTANYNDPAAVAITTTRTVSLGPGVSSTATTSLTVPTTTPAGRYYLCAKADSANVVVETVETNNTLCSAAQVTVPPPDLIISAVSTVTTAVAPGKTFTVASTAMNQGGVKSGAFTVAFHLSADASYGGTDDIAFTATRSISSLAIGAGSTASTTLTVPSNVPLGTYYVCAFADSGNTVDEWNHEDNNGGCTSTTIQVTQPDLVMTVVTPNASTVNRGASLSVANTVMNQGLVSNGAFFQIAFRLSVNTTYGDGDDVTITTIRTLGSLAAGASSSTNTGIVIPTGTPVGVYHVCAMADSLNAVIETDEGNNTFCSGATVTVQ